MRPPPWVLLACLLALALPVSCGRQVPLSPDERDKAFVGEEGPRGRGCPPRGVWWGPGRGSAGEGKPRLAPGHAPVPAGYKEEAAPEEACEDRNANCQNWAATGECEKNPGFMVDACRRACGVCSPAHPPAAPPRVMRISTEYGDMRVRISPGASSVADAIERGEGPDGPSGTNQVFYRAEPPADTRGGGPPYGLLQGRFPVRAFPDKGTPAFEGAKGSAGIGKISGIPGTGDWLIHLQGHKEWDGAFIELGEVVREDLHVAYRIGLLKTHVFTHPDYHVDMLMLDREVAFTVSWPKGDDGANASAS